MAIANTEIGDLFERLANLLEIEGANPFRVRAYRDAARAVRNHSQSMAKLIERDDNPARLPGIGKDLAGKIKTLVETGAACRCSKKPRRALRRPWPNCLKLKRWDRSASRPYIRSHHPGVETPREPHMSRCLNFAFLFLCVLRVFARDRSLMRGVYGSWPRNAHPRSRPGLWIKALWAGIGNVYADEILFHAGIRPGRKISEANFAFHSPWTHATSLSCCTKTGT